MDSGLIVMMLVMGVLLLASFQRHRVMAKEYDKLERQNIDLANKLHIAQQERRHETVG